MVMEKTSCKKRERGRNEKNKSRIKQVRGWKKKKVNNKWIVEENVKCLVFFLLG